MSPKAAATSDRELTAMERLLNLNRKAPQPAPGSEPGVRQIALAEISPNPSQPRQSFADTTIDELADSIRSRGVIQPLLVRPLADEPDRFEIVVGERRFIAAPVPELPYLLVNDHPTRLDADVQHRIAELKKKYEVAGWEIVCNDEIEAAVRSAMPATGLESGEPIPELLKVVLAKCDLAGVLYIHAGEGGGPASSRVELIQLDAEE